jgi:hypothetical protein
MEKETTEKEYKLIDYKKARDEALDNMVKFKELGDSEKAEQFLNMAVHINNLFIHPEPMILPKDCSLI